MYSRGGFNYAALNMPVSRNKAAAAGLPYAAHGFVEPAAQVVKKHRTEQEYFEADSDEDEGPSRRRKDDSESEDDPLDAFMAGLQDDLARDEEISKKKESKKGKGKAARLDIDELDEQEQYLKYMEENPMAGLAYVDDDAFIDYDEDGNPIIPERNRIIDPLPPVDHSEIEYDSYNKNFYEEHGDISRLDYAQLLELRRKLGIRVSGALPPKPCTSFGHFGFDEQLMHYIRKSEYSTPTPIQAQGVPTGLSGRDVIGIAKTGSGKTAAFVWPMLGVPTGLSGRDVIGIAKTGSGKTAAFVWPMLVHIMDQKEISKGDGPIGLILAPTRELAQQIYTEVKRFGKAYNIHCVCAYGGGNMYEQQKACENGPEVIVATPGRLIDLVKKKATNLRRVTYLVFDEADRMFDMGFEPQVRSIANHVRPDRQTQLFSATFRKKVERLARDILTDPVRIVQGDIGEANEDVTQIVEVLPTGPDKWKWLTARLVGFTSVGSVLIFVTKKVNSEELASNLKSQDFDVALLHGDMSQDERNRVITEFKRRMVPILVATDVAARGLDIPHIRTVVNYDVARDIDTHTHRIGRTGRAGQKGTAYTLITNKDVNFAGDLVRNLEGANQQVPQRLIDLANQNPRFKKTRFRAGRAKKLNQGGRGLGYRERPGLGSGDSAGGSLEAPKEEEETAGLYESRLAAMKGAFSSQYKTHFRAASSEATGTEWNVKAAFVPPAKVEPAHVARQPTQHSGLYGSLNSTNYLPGNVPRPSADKFYESSSGKSSSSSSSSRKDHDGRDSRDQRDGKDLDSHGSSVSFRHRRGRFSENDDGRRRRDSHGDDDRRERRRSGDVNKESEKEDRRKEDENKEGENKEVETEEEHPEEENTEGEYGHQGTLMSIAFSQGTTDASQVFRGLQAYNSDDDDTAAEKTSTANTTTQRERSRSAERSRSIERESYRDRYRNRSRSKSRDRDRRRDRDRSRSRSRDRDRRDRDRRDRDRDYRRPSRDYDRDRGRDRYDRDRDRSRGSSRRESSDLDRSRYDDDNGESASKRRSRWDA